MILNITLIYRSNEEMRLIICESHFFVVSLRQNQMAYGHIY